MAASIDLIEVRILWFGLLKVSYLFSDFNQVCGNKHVLIRTCISDSHNFNVVPYNLYYNVLYLAMGWTMPAIMWG